MISVSSFIFAGVSIHLIIGKLPECMEMGPQAGAEVVYRPNRARKLLATRHTRQFVRGSS